MKSKSSSNKNNNKRSLTNQNGRCDFFFIKNFSNFFFTLMGLMTPDDMRKKNSFLSSGNEFFFCQIIHYRYLDIELEFISFIQKWNSSSSSTSNNSLYWLSTKCFPITHILYLCVCLQKKNENKNKINQYIILIWIAIEQFTIVDDLLESNNNNKIIIIIIIWFNPID